MDHQHSSGHSDELIPWPRRSGINRTSTMGRRGGVGLAKDGNGQNRNQFKRNDGKTSRLFRHILGLLLTTPRTLQYQQLWRYILLILFVCLSLSIVEYYTSLMMYRFNHFPLSVRTQPTSGSSRPSLACTAYTIHSLRPNHPAQTRSGFWSGSSPVMFQVCDNV